MALAFDEIKDWAYGTVKEFKEGEKKIVLETGEGALFPVPVNGYYIVVWPANKTPLIKPSAPEGERAEAFRIAAGGLTSDTFTWSTREQLGTEKRTVVAGDQVAAPITAEILEKYQTVLEELNELSTVSELEADIELSSTLTSVLKQEFKANTLKVKTQYELGLHAVHTAGTASSSAEYKLHLGEAGTTADATLASASASATTGTFSLHMRGIVNVRKIGASGEAKGGLEVWLGGVGGSLQTAALTVNTEKTLFLTISGKAGTATIAKDKFVVGQIKISHA